MKNTLGILQFGNSRSNSDFELSLKKQSTNPSENKSQSNIFLNYAQQVNSLKSEISDLKEEKLKLEKQLNQCNLRQSSFTNRETFFKKRIKHLEGLLKQLESSETPTKEGNIENLHHRLISEIDSLQGKTRELIDKKEQETVRELKYQFRKELEMNKPRKKSSKQSTLELKKFKNLLEEQEEKLLYLENLYSKSLEEKKVLKNEILGLQSENEALVNRLKVQIPNRRQPSSCKSEIKIEQHRSPTSRVLIGHENPNDKYRHIVERLKAKVEEEKRKTRLARTAYLQEIDENTKVREVLKEAFIEIESELRNCKPSKKSKAFISRLIDERKVIGEAYLSAYPSRNSPFTVDLENLI